MAVPAEGARNTNAGDAAGSRARILDAAERLIGARGYAGASISMIARESGLPPSSIYWFFGSKEDLLAAVVERGVASWLAAQASWAETARDLRGLIESGVATALAHPDFLRVLFMLTLEGRTGSSKAGGALRAAWRGVEARLEAIMTKHYGLSGHPDGPAIATRLARFALAHFDGLFLDSQVDPDSTRPGDLADDLACALDALAAAAGARPA